MANVTLKNVCKAYGDVVISRDVNLDIKEGEFVVFVGPSGCGKSTLLRCIAGLEDITSGDLYIGDERVNDTEPSKRGVGMVFQSYALYPHLNLYDNMSFGLKLAKADKKRSTQESITPPKSCSSDTCLTVSPKHSPADSASGLPLAEPWFHSPGCSCSTSLYPISMPRSESICAAK